MKTNKMIKSLAMLLLPVLLIAIVNVIPAEAGLSATVRDSSTIQDEINTSVWNNADGKIVASDGVIIIPNESTQNTKLITKSQAVLSEGIENVATAEATLKFTNLPKGEQFALGFGLASIESGIGELGNVEVLFTNDNGFKVAVVAYAEDGQVTEVMSPKACGSLGNTKVKAVFTAKQQLHLTVNGKKVCEASVPVTGKGRVGFVQTGGCGVEIRNINIVTYSYDRPENCDIYEDFEDGEFNANLLNSKMIYNAVNDSKPYVGIDEYEGNKVFRFRQPRLCYLGTRYSYSNFEMTFDVPYIQRIDELDDEGNVVEYRSGQLMIAFGSEGAIFNDYAYEGSAEYLLFRGTSDIARKDQTVVSLKETFPFFDPSYNKGFSIKLCVIDNQVTVYMKWIDDTDWLEVMSYGIATPTGTIQIWGQQDCNWVIDNFQIINKDSNPALIEVEYESSILKVPEDYNYEPAEKVYMPEKVEEKQLSVYLIIPIFAVVCILAFGTVVLVHNKKKKKEGGVNDEE